MTRAFNGDEILFGVVKELVTKHGINLIVETGTYKGDTTLELSELANQVHTFEINPAYQAQARSLCREKTNIHFHTGSSGKLLFDFQIWRYEKPLIFLDAHWNNYNPLLDELAAIASFKIKPVILIHDFFVPGHSTEDQSGMWGYDCYNGQCYTWEWVKESIEKIYGPDGYVKRYNDYYEASRGCLIIEPK